MLVECCLKSFKSWGSLIGASAMAAADWGRQGWIKNHKSARWRNLLSLKIFEVLSLEQQTKCSPLWHVFVWNRDLLFDYNPAKRSHRSFPSMFDGSSRSVPANLSSPWTVPGHRRVALGMETGNLWAHPRLETSFSPADVIRKQCMLILFQTNISNFEVYPNSPPNIFFSVSLLQLFVRVLRSLFEGYFRLVPPRFAEMIKQIGWWALPGFSAFLSGCEGCELEFFFCKVSFDTLLEIQRKGCTKSGTCNVFFKKQ